MGLKSIEIISIPVNDQDKSLAFYRDVLGFQVAMDMPYEENKRWIQLVAKVGDTTSISLMQSTIVFTMGSIHGIYLATDDIVEYREKIMAAGVAVADIMDTPWGKFADLKDPDGNGLSLHQM
ncbi:MAG: VOC family protein [bacterium]